MTGSMIDSRVHAFEAALDLNRHTLDLAKTWPGAELLLTSIRDEKWSVVRSEAKKIYETETDASMRGFAIQWLVGSCDYTGEDELRRSFLKLWEGISDWSENTYCVYIRTFQEGCGHFGAGNLREAEALFKRSCDQAKSMHYLRGYAVSLFHLGLTYRDLRHRAQAEKYFQRALETAQAMGSERLILRFSGQLPSMRWEAEIAEIERLIVQLEFESARVLVMQTDWKWRREKPERAARNLHLYLSLFAYARGRERLGDRLLEKIQDPILKIRVLELKKKSLALSGRHEALLKYLRELRGLGALISGRSLGDADIEICGISLSSIREQDVRQLMRTLLSSEEPIEKERICEAVWKLRYDPTLHDPKLYRLFSQARKLFGRPDLFVNTYGAYRINPAMFGEKTVA